MYRRIVIEISNFMPTDSTPTALVSEAGTIKSTILLWLLYKWYARHRSEYFTTFGRWHSHSLSKGETHGYETDDQRNVLKFRIIIHQGPYPFDWWPSLRLP